MDSIVFFCHLALTILAIINFESLIIRTNTNIHGTHSIVIFEKLFRKITLIYECNKKQQKRTFWNKFMKKCSVFVVLTYRCLDKLFSNTIRFGQIFGNWLFSQIISHSSNILDLTIFDVTNNVESSVCF